MLVEESGLTGAGNEEKRAGYEGGGAGYEGKGAGYEGQGAEYEEERGDMRGKGRDMRGKGAGHEDGRHVVQQSGLRNSFFLNDSHVNEP